jgi:crotonobetainyl-CoA hydratase
MSLASDVTNSDDTASVTATRLPGVTVLTLNRPAQRNAVNADISQRMGDLVSEADRDPDVHVIVVTGAGDSAFCSGADLRALARGESIIPKEIREWGFAGFVRHDLSTPTIAAVNGLALGGGFEIVLACDIAIASSNAVFGLPEVRVGQLATAGGLFRLARQVPSKIAAEMLMSGEPITAESALSWGLISRLVAPGQALEESLAVARVIASNAPLSVRASRRVLRGVVEGHLLDDESGWSATDDERRALRGTHDSQEGAVAFAEKRPPLWLGR